MCRFFLLWSPDVYGEPGDADAVANRGFELITEDLEWEEPSPVRRPKPTKKGKNQTAIAAKKGEPSPHDVDDDDDPLGVTAELAKESWEVIYSIQFISIHLQFFSTKNVHWFPPFPSPSFLSLFQS